MAESRISARLCSRMRRIIITGARYCLCSVIIGVISPAMAEQCTFVMNALAVPSESASTHNFDTHKSYYVRGATRDVPLSITLNATGKLSLRWSRSYWFQNPEGERPILRQQLQVEKSSGGSNSFVTFCSTSWLPLDRLPFGMIVLSSNAPVTWRIKVFQQNQTPLITILDEDLSRVDLSGSFDSNVIVEPAPLLTFQEWRDMVPLPHTPSCKISDIPIPSDSVLVDTIRLPTDVLDVPGSIYLLSGRNIYLTVNHVGHGSPVTVVLQGKPVGFAHATIPICTVRLMNTTPQSGQTIIGTAPWEENQAMRWVVTLASDQPSPAIDFNIYRERRPSRPPIEPNAHGSDLYTCTQEYRNPVSQNTTDYSPVFQSAYALTVHSGLKEIGITGAAYRDIMAALLNALENWRISCAMCTPYQFSVVDVDGDVYVPNGMLRGPEENYRATFDAGPWLPNHVPVSMKNMGFFTSSSGFVKVSDSMRQRRRFCNQLPEQYELFHFSAAESPLCRPTMISNDDEMIIHFRWHRDGLPNSDNQEVVAIWNGTDTIDVNLLEYSYYAGDVGQVLVGSANRQVDLIRIFTHEVGHWLGLDHQNYEGNIMAPKYPEARCIDDTILDELNKLAAGQRKPSYESGALLYR